MKITGVLCEQAAIRNDFRAGVLKSYTVKCIDIQLQLARADSETMAGQAGIAVNLL